MTTFKLHFDIICSFPQPPGPHVGASLQLVPVPRSLLQRRYIKNGSEVSKTDYLRGKEMKNGVMESVYHTDGRAVKSGGTWPPGMGR